MRLHGWVEIFRFLLELLCTSLLFQAKIFLPFKNISAILEDLDYNTQLNLHTRF